MLTETILSGKIPEAPQPIRASQWTPPHTHFLVLILINRKYILFWIFPFPAFLLSFLQNRQQARDQDVNNDNHCGMKHGQHKIMITQFHVMSLEKKVIHNRGKKNLFSFDSLKTSQDFTRAGYFTIRVSCSGIQELEEGARGNFKIALKGGQAWFTDLLHCVTHSPLGAVAAMCFTFLF